MQPKAKKHAQILWAMVRLGADVSADTLIGRAQLEDIAAMAGRRADKGRVALAARGLLRSVLSVAGDRTDWHIRPDGRGKPFLFDDLGQPGPFMSLSHSGDYVAVAVSMSEMMGIDVEIYRPRDFPRLAAYAFGPWEAVIAARGAPDFYRLWTLREAMGKWDGQGLRLAADGQDRITRPEETGLWRDGGWNLFHTVGDQVSLAIAGQQDVPWQAASLCRLPVADML